MPVIKACDQCKSTTDTETRTIYTPWKTLEGYQQSGQFILCKCCWDSFNREVYAYKRAYEEQWLRSVNVRGLGALFKRS